MRGDRGARAAGVHAHAVKADLEELPRARVADKGEPAVLQAGPHCSRAGRGRGRGGRRSEQLRAVHLGVGRKGIHTSGGTGA